MGERFLIQNEQGEPFWLTSYDLSKISKGLVFRKEITKNINLIMEVDNPQILKIKHFKQEKSILHFITKVVKSKSIYDYV